MNAIPELPYQCSRSSARFYSPSTCEIKIQQVKDADKKLRGNFSGLDHLSMCRGCGGPLLNGEQVEVTPRRLVFKESKPKTKKPSVPVISKPKIAKNDVVVNKDGKTVFVKPPRKTGYTKPNSVARRFAALAPDDPWQGTTCGCLKSRSDFAVAHICKTCFNAARPSRSKYGLGKLTPEERKQQAAAAKKARHYGLYRLKVGQEQKLRINPRRTVEMVLKVARDEAQRVKNRYGMILEVQQRGMRVTVRRVK